MSDLFIHRGQHTMSFQRDWGSRAVFNIWTTKRLYLLLEEVRRRDGVIADSGPALASGGFHVLDDAVLWRGFLWEQRLSDVLNPAFPAGVQASSVAAAAARRTIEVIPPYGHMNQVLEGLRELLPAPVSWYQVSPAELAVEQLLTPCFEVWRQLAPQLGLRETLKPNGLPGWFAPTY